MGSVLSLLKGMDTQYGGGTVSKFSFNRLEKVGIENICLKSAYQSATDVEHSWNAIAFYSIENACEASSAHADIGPHHRWAMGTEYFSGNTINPVHQYSEVCGLLHSK